MTTPPQQSNTSESLIERLTEILFDPDEQCWKPNDEVHARGDCGECNRMSSLVNFILSERADAAVTAVDEQQGTMGCGHAYACLQPTDKGPEACIVCYEIGLKTDNAAAEMVERCAVEICFYCRKGDYELRLEQDIEGTDFWTHHKGNAHAICKASSIRALPPGLDALEKKP